MKELEKIINYNIYDKTVWREYYVNDKGQKYGIYKFWGRNGRMNFMDQNKNNNDHGIRVEFQY